MNKLNQEWHLAHRMPKKATLEQRYMWHTEHAKHCQCRPMQEKLQQQFSQFLKKPQ